jgi:hypothetical protein
MCPANGLGGCGTSHTSLGIEVDEARDDFDDF